MPQPALDIGPTPAAPPYPTRFSWPMRVFLFVLVFDIVFRSCSILIDRDNDWPGELSLRTMPVRLDTRAERAEKLRQWAPGQPNPVTKDIKECLDSIWEFFKPWPRPKTQERIHSWRDSGKYVYCWLNTRLSFLENLVGINEEWPMFSPYVAAKKDITRARLTFADGSTRIVRQRRDPEDLCHYSHWFEEKVLNYERLVLHDGWDRYKRGYCNLLAYRYPRNEAGSPLVSIRLFNVTYEFPPPGEDAVAHLRAQTGPPPEQISGDYFHYDVATREWHNINP